MTLLFKLNKHYLVDKLLLILAFLLTSIVISVAQDGQENILAIPVDISEIFQKGEKALLEKEYEKALKFFEKAVGKRPRFVAGLQGVGASQELLGNYSAAAEAYQKILQIDPNYSRVMYFESGRSYLHSGQYQKALQQFYTFKHAGTGDYKSIRTNSKMEADAEALYLKELEKSISICHFAMDSVKYAKVNNMVNLGESINTSADEYFPFLSNDGQLIFYTTREDNYSDEDLFVSRLIPRERIFAEGKPLTDGFNSDENEGMSTLVRNGKKVFFTACGRTEVMGSCDIWEADMKEEHIFNAKPMKGSANTNSWESQASVSCDGQTLFFTSDRKEGEGGTDIWMAQRLENGGWGEATNLGSNVNTNYDEEAPFITDDGMVLYFSSDGHAGFGEQDIFMSRKGPDGKWSRAVNLGQPLNSPKRELGFFLSADGGTGYIASDREQGFGGMDIYKFTMPEKLHTEPITFVEGQVRDAVLKTAVQTVVKIKGHRPFLTDEKGRFFLCLPAEKDIQVSIPHKEYKPYKNSFSIPRWDNKANHRISIELEPKFELPVYEGEVSQAFEAKKVEDNLFKLTVWFDFNKENLKLEMQQGLEDFVAQTIGEKSVNSVKIIGFTDGVGSDEYNQVLSEKRARQVGNFLTKQGLTVDNIAVEGRGKANVDLPDWANRKVEVFVGIE